MVLYSIGLKHGDILIPFPFQNSYSHCLFVHDFVLLYSLDSSVSIAHGVVSLQKKKKWSCLLLRSKISQALYQGPKHYKIEIWNPFGSSKKGQGPNGPIKGHLKQVGGGRNPWIGKLWALENKGKEKRKLSPALVKEICYGTQKGLNQDTWGFLETWDPQDMQKEIG